VFLGWVITVSLSSLPTVCRRSRKPRVTKAFITHWFINIAKLNYVKSSKHPRETYKNLAH
ncbi:MAG: hypothetical protein QW630_02150, partial [Sulfolobales archaeon]